MSQNVGAKTKGLIKNNTTGEVKKFQFNPPDHEYARGVTYATIDSPGMAYPDTQFVKGNIRTFDCTLFFFDKPFTNKFKEWTWFLGAFLTPEVCTPGYTKPPELTFVMGSWARTCVLENLDIHIMEYDNDLQPVNFEIKLSLRQVGT